VDITHRGGPRAGLSLNWRPKVKAKDLRCQGQWQTRTKTNRKREICLHSEHLASIDESKSLVKLVYVSSFAEVFNGLKSQGQGLTLVAGYEADAIAVSMNTQNCPNFT